MIMPGFVMPRRFLEAEMTSDNVGDMFGFKFKSSACYFFAVILMNAKPLAKNRARKHFTGIERKQYFVLAC